MLPLMMEALGGITKTMQFAIISQMQVDFDTVETITELGYFQASAQPLHPREVLLKPEGLRKWKWYTIWTTQDLPVDNFILEINTKVQFRVMSKSDWREAGYFEYEIVQSSKVLSEAP